jgi:hypothetical protein
MAVVSVSDLEDYLGRVLTGPDVTAASVVLDMVQDDMESYLGRTIEVAQFTDTRYLYANPGYPRSFVPLTQTPVQTVVSVTVDGTSFTADQWAIERSGIELLTVNIPTDLLDDPPQAVIVYTAGLGEPAVSQLKFTILTRAARLMNRRKDDLFGARDASVEGYRVLYESDQWSDRELMVADRWKRRMISRHKTADRYSSFRSW